MNATIGLFSGSTYSPTVFKSHSGSVINTYDVMFKKEINYCDEILELFESINHTLACDYKVKESPNYLVLSFSHNSSLALNEVDLVLMFLTAVYYDCTVRVWANDVPKYDIRVIDGYVKSIEKIVAFSGSPQKTL